MDWRGSTIVRRTAMFSNLGSAARGSELSDK